MEGTMPTVDARSSKNLDRMESSLRPFLRCTMKELVGLHNDITRSENAIVEDDESPPLGERDDIEEIGLIELGSRLLEAAKNLREKAQRVEHLLAGPLDDPAPKKTAGGVVVR